MQWHRHFKRQQSKTLNFIHNTCYPDTPQRITKFIKNNRPLLSVFKTPNYNITSSQMFVFLISCRPPADPKLWTSISNGHVATIVHSDSVYMNGLYNGNGTTSTRGRLPALTSLEVLNLTSYRNVKTSFCLHIKTGTCVAKDAYSQLWST